MSSSEQAGANDDRTQRGRRKVSAKRRYNWGAISAVAAVATAIVAVIALWPQFRFQAPPTSSGLEPSGSRPVVVADVVHTPFSMPPTLIEERAKDCARLLERADSVLFSARGDYLPEGRIQNILAGDCDGGRTLLRYFFGFDQFISVKLVNEGNEMARAVSVRLPLTVGDWQRQGAERHTVTRQISNRPYTVEIGDVRPGEVVHLRAWAGSSADTVAVFFASGRAEIRR